MERNRTSHDAFIHILSAHLDIVLVISCVSLSATHQLVIGWIQRDLTLPEAPLALN